MRTKNKTLTYSMTIDKFTNRFTGSAKGESLDNVHVCKNTARDAFDIGIKRSVDFEITNVKPKSLRRVHILKKDKWGDWEVRSTMQNEGLYYETQQEIERQFPKNTTLYVSVYA